MMVAQISLWAVDQSMLYVSTVLVGIGYGFVFGSAPAIVSTYFGVDSFGSNWGCNEYTD